MFTRKSISQHALTYLLLFFLASCSKNADKNVATPNSNTQLVFTVSEQTGDPGGNMATHRASSAAGGARFIREDNVQHHFIENGAFRITTSLVMESAASSWSKPTVSNKVSPRMSGAQTAPSSTLVEKNTKYRVVLYDRSTSPSTFVSTTLGTAGAPLYIAVDKGKDYDWAVFSFNDANDPGEAQEVVRSDNRDLLYAKGTTGIIPGVSGDQQMYTIPVNVQLQHKLSRVSIQVSAKEYPAKITDIGASLGRSSYFCKNILDIKTGDFVYQNTQIDMDEAIPFNFTEGDSVIVADYYTSKFAPISNFFVTLNRLTIQPASGRPSSLSSPTRYSWNDPIVPAQGRSVTAKINIQPVRDISGEKFKILSIGSFEPYGFFDQPNSGIWHALHSAKNFGPTGTYPTANLHWEITHKPVSLYGYDDLLTAGYKMVFVSYRASPVISPSHVDRMLEYIERGGTVIWFTEQQIYVNDAAVWKNFAGNGAVARLNNRTHGALNQHPILNGPFGDARGTTFGHYESVGFGIQNFTKPVEVLAVSTTNSALATIWKAKDKNFYFFGNGGMQNYSADPGEHARGIAPFLLTDRSDYQPRIGAWYNQQHVSNSVVIMNIIAKTIDDTMTSNK